MVIKMSVNKHGIFLRTFANDISIMTVSLGGGNVALTPFRIGAIGVNGIAFRNLEEPLEIGSIDKEKSKELIEILPDLHLTFSNLASLDVLLNQLSIVRERIISYNEKLENGE